MSKSYYNYSVCDPENNQNLQTSIIEELSEKPLAISLNMLQGQPLTTREIFYDYNIASKIAAGTDPYPNLYNGHKLTYITHNNNETTDNKFIQYTVFNNELRGPNFSELYVYNVSVTTDNKGKKSASISNAPTFSINTNGNTSVGGTLNVTGVATFSSTISAISGKSTLHSLDVNGATILKSTLNVTESTTLSSTLNVTGAATFSSTISATSAKSTLHSLDVNGATTLNDITRIIGKTSTEDIILSVKKSTSISNQYANIFDVYTNKINIHENLTLNSASLIFQNGDSTVTAFDSDGILNASSHPAIGTETVTKLSDTNTTNKRSVFVTGVEIDNNGHVKGVTSGKVEEVSLLDTAVELSADLYLYSPIGCAKKASNKELSSTGRDISQTNPAKIGSAGDSIRAVLERIFGTETDTNTSLSNNTSLSVNSGTSIFGGGEYGNSVNPADQNIVFTLNNTGSCTYGYKYYTSGTSGSISKTSNTTFYYPTIKDTVYTTSDIKLTMPATITETSESTISQIKYTILSFTYNNNSVSIKIPSSQYKGYSNEYVYCALDNNKTLSFILDLPNGNNTANKTLCASIKAEVTLGLPQFADSLTASKTITKFLTYLETQNKDPQVTSPDVTAGGSDDESTSEYEITKGTIFNFITTTDDDEIPDSNASFIATSDFKKENYTPGNKYLWFLLPTNSYTKIQQEVSPGDWADMTTTYAGTTTLQTFRAGRAGTDITYYAYRTDKLAMTQAGNFRIIEIKEEV